MDPAGAALDVNVKEHDHRTSKEIWDPEEAGSSAPEMVRRIEATLKSKYWNHILAVLARGAAPVEKLRIAEVGCGTGTVSLMFGLLGASVALIDYNRKVLEKTKRTYGEFGCGGEFIHADCLKPAPEGLAGAFDVVFSGGLAEHFTGAYRGKCVDYHVSLLKPGGLAVIGVPNRLSPFYQWIRIFRMLTGTWELDVEAPFSNAELKRFAGKSGLKNYYVLGACSLTKDLFVYSRGFLSAAVDLCPKNITAPLRKWKTGVQTRASAHPAPGAYAAQRCRGSLESAGKGPFRYSPSVLSDWLSSGLFLIGVK